MSLRTHEGYSVGGQTASSLIAPQSCSDLSESVLPESRYPAQEGNSSRSIRKLLISDAPPEEKTADRLANGRKPYCGASRRLQKSGGREPFRTTLPAFFPIAHKNSSAIFSRSALAQSAPASSRLGPIANPSVDAVVLLGNR